VCHTSGGGVLGCIRITDIELNYSGYDYCFKIIVVIYGFGRCNDYQWLMLLTVGMTYIQKRRQGQLSTTLCHSRIRTSWLVHVISIDRLLCGM